MSFFEECCCSEDSSTFSDDFLVEFNDQIKIPDSHFTSCPGRNQSLSELMILVAEDDEFAWSCTRRQLFAFEVHRVKTGAEVIDFYEKNFQKISFIIMDYEMGDGLNGWQAAMEIRNFEMLKNLAFKWIFFSSSFELAQIMEFERSSTEEFNNANRNIFNDVLSNFANYEWFRAQFFVEQLGKTFGLSDLLCLLRQKNIIRNHHPDIPMLIQQEMSKNLKVGKERFFVFYK